MFIRKITKQNKNSNKVYEYYRLVHSYRLGNKTRQQSLLNLGTLEGLDREKHKALADRIEAILTGATSLFDCTDLTVNDMAHKFARQIKEKKIFTPALATADNKAKIGEEKTDGDSQMMMVDISTIDKEDDKEIGGPWLCKQTFDLLKLNEIFEKIGLDEKQIYQCYSLLTAKMIHPSSELESERWMHENSALSELYGSQGVPSRYKMYQVTEQLYGKKKIIEKHIYDSSEDMFSSQNKIVIYDLTNMYFEGRMQGAKKAKHGRSKEKRSDCKLVGLSMAIDSFGFVRHCQIYQGNISEPDTLTKLLDEVKSKLSFEPDKPMVVMDAGIATEDNLNMLAEKKYDYVCVSRTKIKDYDLVSDKEILIKSRLGQPIHIKKIKCTKRNETMLYVRSEQKALKEESMDAKRTKRLEEALQYIKEGLSLPRRMKKIEKIHERIGRLRQQYPSVAKLYEINYIEDKKLDVVTDITWIRNETKETSKGVYFLRYSRQKLTEKQIWDMYNMTREVESTFRCLKTDLNIRPIFHQKDKWIEAHIWLGIIAYQAVNTIRQKLKAQGIHYSWKTIVEKMKSQQSSLISIKVQGEQMLYARVCSRPQKTVAEIYDALNYKHRPYVRKTNVVTQM